MNKDETLKLFAKEQAEPGAWNAWANEMLARRAQLEAAGEWAVREKFGLEEPGNKTTAAWCDAATTDFSECLLAEAVNFTEFHFPFDAIFTKACFQKAAKFKNTSFGGVARFDNTKFGGYAFFDDSTFSGSAEFNGATFIRNATFDSATFIRNATFDSATFSGYVGLRQSKFGQEARFKNATFSGLACFEHVTFRGNVSFGQVTTFERDALFNGTTFGGKTWFKNAIFGGDAEFCNVTFMENVWFQEAEFGGHTQFCDAIFEVDALFKKAIFKCEVSFKQATFKRFADFEETKFSHVARFTAIHAERAFTIVRARFGDVPGFVQAHFKEAPRLDNIVIPEWPFCPLDRARDGAIAAQYRALKRLAIQAHDHKLELDFFASELKASPGKVLAIFGFLYNRLSRYGRSMVRPLIWLLVSSAVFTWTYLREHFSHVTVMGKTYSFTYTAWLQMQLGQAVSDGLAWFAGGFPPEAALRDICAWIGRFISPMIRPEPLTCLVGQETNPAIAAIGLSIRKALPFAGVASAEKLNQIYACLYGIHQQPVPAVGSPLPARFTPVIPDVVDYLGTVQLLLSLVLIFLFLLAVRNHFRIR